MNNMNNTSLRKKRTCQDLKGSDCHLFSVHYEATQEAGTLDNLKTLKVWRNTSCLNSFTMSCFHFQMN